MTAEEPLREWRFSGALRASQQQLLQAVTVVPGEPVHIVSPPGSGKTLMGLLLAMRQGARTVVFAPTTTIAGQWARQACTLAPSDRAVSIDGEYPADLTVLTYQRISTTERGGAFDELARRAWQQELVDGGRDTAHANAWLASLSTSNEKAYTRGIARRARAVRKAMARLSPDELAAGLHPNARDLVDRLVAHGVKTIVLDECHHLLDHWALVIAYLEARLRAAAVQPTLIGLTATAPSPQDATGFENYSALLGEVDFEQPTPAVVKEGNLAPYRDLVWFTEPTAPERVFLMRNDELLTALIVNTIGSADGISSLRSILLPPLSETNDTDGSARPVGAVVTTDADVSTTTARIAAAFAADFPLAIAATSLLRKVAPHDDLLPLLPPTTGAIDDAEIRVLARYLMQRVLPDPAREQDWNRARSLLADFGYALTDRGIRKTRDPIDTLLASTIAKDRAVADILAWEYEHGVGDRLRAVVVTDFAKHGNRAGNRASSAGALRTFSVIVADDRSAGMMPVLVTARHLRIAARDLSMLLPRLAEITGVVPEIVPTDDDDQVIELKIPGVSAAHTVAAVSKLLARGFVRVIVGTRGLLGEGWDSPAANTLIDITTASTSTATQQLRGRTMRLDHEWPDKVAHNWTVVAILPEARTAIAHSDVRRLRCKLDALWGVQVEGPPRVVRGEAMALTRAQSESLQRLGTTMVRAQTLTAATLDTVLPRSMTAQRWRVGEPFTGVVRRASLFPTTTSPQSVLISTRHQDGIAMRAGAYLAGAVVTIGAGVWTQVGLVAPIMALMLAVAGILLGVGGVRGMRVWCAMRAVRADALAGHAQIADVVATVLRMIGAISEGDPEVHTVDGGVAVSLANASDADAQVFRQAVQELYGPITTPRFLLDVDPDHNRAAQSEASPITAVAVPSVIGKRRQWADMFAAHWAETVAPAQLRALAAAEDVAILVSARAQPREDTLSAIARDVWS